MTAPLVISGVRMGRLRVDVLERSSALDAVRRLVEAGRGGAVFTPNVDHVVMAERHPSFECAYRRASLTFADGAPIVWASKLIGPALPEKLSGSDMLYPLVRLAAEHGWRVYLLGGGPGVATEAADRMRAEFGVDIVGTDDAHIKLDDPAADAPVLARIRAARPHLIFVALGAPKQELWIDQARHALGGAVAIGVGASLDFVAGKVRRAPSWMSKMGLEWFYRLCQEPRRLWRRYLVHNVLFLWYLARERG